jgi:ABC-type phosphate/phosphonate transport system permease subunit
MPDTRVETAPPGHVRSPVSTKVLNPAIFGLRDFSRNEPGAGGCRSDRPASRYQAEAKLNEKRHHDVADRQFHTSQSSLIGSIFGTPIAHQIAPIAAMAAVTTKALSYPARWTMKPVRIGPKMPDALPIEF